jgi:hypothetical protein
LTADLIFGNSQKSYGTKAGEQSGCPISIINFLLDRLPCELEYCHGGEFNWAKVLAFFYTQLHVMASVFPNNKLG